MHASTAAIAPAPRAWPVYLVTIALQFVAAAGLVTLYSTMSTLIRETGDAATIGWAVTAYLLASAVSATLCGRLGDLVGRREVALVVLASAGLGAVIASASTDAPWLVAGCALQGAAGALTPLSLGMVRTGLPPSRVPFAVGVVSAAGIAGAGVCYLLAGWIIDHFASHGAFMMKAVLAALAGLATARWIPRARVRASLHGIDFLRGCLFVPAIAALLVGLKQGGEQGWWRPWGAPLAIAGLVLLLVWARHQWRQPRPLIDLRLLRSRQLLLTHGAMLCLGMGSIQLGQMMAIQLQQPAASGAGFGFSATVAGWLLLPLNLVALVISPYSGRLAGRFGARPAALLGAAVSLLAWAMLTAGHRLFPVTLAAAVISTLGYCVLAPAIYNLIVEEAPADRTSEATGTAYVLMTVAMAIGAQVLFGLLGTETVKVAGAGYPGAHAYTLAYGFGLAMCVLCLAVLRAIPRRPAR